MTGLSEIQGPPLHEETGIGALTLPGFIDEIARAHGGREALRWRDLFARRLRMAWGLLRGDPQARSQAQKRFTRQSEEDQLIGWVLGEHRV